MFAVTAVAVVSLPPVLGDWVSCRRDRRTGVVRTSPSRADRLFRTLLFASAVTLMLGVAEYETAMPCGQTPLTVHPPGHVLAHDSAWQWIDSRARRARHEVENRLLPPSADSEWEIRTHFTWASFVTAAIVGIGLFRPWRRASAAPERGTTDALGPSPPVA